MSIETESSYNFYVDRSAGGQITANDNPFFQVSFGRRSRVLYRDAFNDELELGASFEAAVVTVGTHYLLKRLQVVPPGVTKDQYARLVLHRIRAAGTWDRYSVVFTGPLSDDPAPASE